MHNYCTIFRAAGSGFITLEFPISSWLVRGWKSVEWNLGIDCPRQTESISKYFQRVGAFLCQILRFVSEGGMCAGECNCFQTGRSFFYLTLESLYLLYPLCWWIFLIYDMLNWMRRCNKMLSFVMPNKFRLVQMGSLIT
jgi:hypothetical protein